MYPLGGGYVVHLLKSKIAFALYNSLYALGGYLSSTL
jgi:hypothetical protein